MENDVFKETETYMYLGGREVGHPKPGFGALQAPLPQYMPA